MGTKDGIKIEVCAKASKYMHGVYRVTVPGCEPETIRAKGMTDAMRIARGLTFIAKRERYDEAYDLGD